MTAFGPYKGKETIDFEQLDGANLFVISGNTGAGKTTIFDGICFALYGSASGEDRGSSTMLRSHFADDDVHTAVEFVFALHERTYRILRQLPHTKKGNKSSTGDRYEFFEIKDSGEIPVVERQIVSEINTKVEHMIGLTQEQFKQIVMLPQGEFRKLLTSDTENKERILRKIFKTERYNELSDRIRKKREDIQRTYEQEVQERNHYVQQIGSIFPHREDVPLFDFIQAEEKNMYQIDEGLTEEIHYYTEKMKKDQQAYETAYAEHEKKQKEFVQAQATHELFMEREEKEKRADVLKDRAPLIKEKERTFERADRASRITVFERHARDLVEGERKQIGQLKEIQALFDTSVARLAAHEKKYAAAEEQTPVREQLQKDLDRYEYYLPTVKEIASNEKRRHTLQAEAEILEKQVQASTTEVDTIQKHMEQLRKEINAMDKETSTLFDKERLRQKMREHAGHFQVYAKEQQKLQAIDQEIARHKETYEAAQKIYEEIEHTWLHSQASMLAAHLHDGDPCPVCGSVDHPAKETAREQDVSREQLEAAKKDADEKNTEYRTALRTRASIEEQLEEYWKVIYEIYPIQTNEVEETFTKLVDKGKKITKEIDQLTETKKSLDQKKETYEKMIEQEKEVLIKRDETKKNYDSKIDQFKEMETQQKTQLRDIPEDLRSLEELEKRMKQTAEKLKQFQEAWETVQKELQQAKDRRTELAAAKKSKENELGEAQKRREEAEKQFSEALAKGDFSSEEDYHAALVDEQTQAQLKKEIEAYHQERVLLSERLAQIEKALADKEFVELDQMKAALAQLKKTSEDLWKVMHASKQYVERGQTIQEHLRNAHEQVKGLEKKRAITADVYDVIRGQNGPKISFERYIQMDYLEQIIEAANERFRILSNGQYTLLRSDRQETHGRQSGLALDVHDAYTGQKRDVKTLSGGEKFNASLSLALGMSDVVQSFQGNVSVETMFIDEGFGTLDEESLQNAIDTLIDLQRSGRMIGVISHVEQLKELFPAVLEVKKTKEGYSETNFVVK